MGSDFYLFSVILTVFESGGDNSKHLLGNQSDDNFTVPTTMPNPSQTIFWGSREKHQEVFPRGDNCFLMIFTKPNKSFWIRKILNGFWHSEGFCCIFGTSVHICDLFARWKTLGIRSFRFSASRELIWQRDKVLIYHLKWKLVKGWTYISCIVGGWQLTLTLHEKCWKCNWGQ